MKASSLSRQQTESLSPPLHSYRSHLSKCEHRVHYHRLLLTRLSRYTFLGAFKTITLKGTFWSQSAHTHTVSLLLRLLCALGRYKNNSLWYNRDQICQLVAKDNRNIKPLLPSSISIACCLAIWLFYAVPSFSNNRATG